MTRLPDDRDMEQAVRSWMRDDEEHPADRNRQVGRIMGRIDETRQRRGAWRFLPFWRGSKRVDGSDDELHPARRSGIAPAFMGLVAILALMVTSIAFLALRPNEQVLAPGASPSSSPSPAPTMDPDDAALFERLAASTWQGTDTDVDAVLELYDDDAVHTALWLDTSERFDGNQAIADRMRVSERVESTGQEWVRLPDHGLSRRYFGYAPSLSGTACVIWIRGGQIDRHDCILPMSIRGQAPTEAAAPDQAAVEAREQLTSALSEAQADGDLLKLGGIIAPDIIHHVRSDNDAYVIEGFSEWAGTMSGGPPKTRANIDLPAPHGELRWANFSSVGTGALCLFWARDGQIFRHDCVVPGYTPFGLGTPEAEALSGLDP